MFIKKIRKLKINSMIINKKYLAEYSNLPIPSNYNYSEVMNYVDISEKIWIIPCIGLAQYDELQEQVKNNTLTPENSTLLVEAIWPYLGFCVMYEALPAIAYHASEVSLTKGKSENSDPLTLKEIGFYQEHIRRQIEARKNFAIQWIKDRIQYYPLIAQCTSCDCSCNNNAKLNPPNKLQELYSTRRKCTDLR